MNINSIKQLPLIAFSMMAVAVGLNADNYDKRDHKKHDRRERCDDCCAPTPPAPCYSECEPECVYCLGPRNVAGNPAVRPKTCNGDYIFTIAGFYWNAHQDGMEYAISNQVTSPINSAAYGTTPATTNSVPAIQQLNNLVDAKYINPDFKWQFGFKVGVGYASTCDGWDFNALWTWYQGRAHRNFENDQDSNRTIVTLWSAFAPALGNVTFASEANSRWKLHLNLVDLELGREFWNSRYLTLRPHMGLRIAFLKQHFDIQHAGGSWNALTAGAATPGQLAFNNEVNIKNNYWGVGIRGGLDSLWNFGRGFGLYGNLAASIVYGRFHVDHKENNRMATSPDSSFNVLETEDSFRASRGMLDLALGFQYETMFCNCRYSFVAMIGWENHLFFNQNQMWRVTRIGDDVISPSNTPATPVTANNSGENVFTPSRGDLSTQGWTLTFKFSF